MQATGNNSTSTYSLSIRLHADGFSFYRYSAYGLRPPTVEHYTVAATETYASALEEALTKSAIVRQSFNVAYAIITGPSIDVPIDCFRKEEAEALFLLTRAEETIENIHYNILPQLEIAKIFNMKKDVEQILQSRFPAIRLYHVETMLQEKLLLYNAQKNENFYVYFLEHSFCIFHFKDGKLDFSNQFPTDDVENIAFFIISVWKELKMGHQGQCLVLGKHPLRAACIQLLRKFIHEVREASYTDVFPEKEIMKDISIPLDVLTLYI